MLDADAARDDLDFAAGVLAAEAQAIRGVSLDDAFPRAVELVLDAAARGGSVVVSGLGKSGLIGQKLSATFASTGTPSHFLHPVEAMHGDLGRVRRGDAVLMLSYTGTTDELIALASLLRQDRVTTIAVVGKGGSDLERLATATLRVGDVTEACPHNLAPTASTAAMLAVGDALALTVSRRRRFGVDDFKRVHPGGSLGRQLMPVTQAMRFHAAWPDANEGQRAGGGAGEGAANLPLVPMHWSMERAYDEAARVEQRTGVRRPGALVVVDDAGRLAGIFTDGDLRRRVFEAAKRGEESALLRRPIAQVMTPDPRHLPADALVRDAVRLMRELRIDEAPVVDVEGRPIGLIDVQDLVALKVIEG